MCGMHFFCFLVNLVIQGKIPTIIVVKVTDRNGHIEVSVNFRALLDCLLDLLATLCLERLVVIESSELHANGGIGDVVADVLRVTLAHLLGHFIV